MTVTYLLFPLLLSTALWIAIHVWYWEPPHSSERNTPLNEIRERYAKDEIDMLELERCLEAVLPAEGNLTKMWSAYRYMDCSDGQRVLDELANQPLGKPGSVIVLPAGWETKQVYTMGGQYVGEYEKEYVKRNPGIWERM